MTAHPAPIDDQITPADLARDPYPIYRRLRAEAPVLKLAALGRTLLTKAADTRYVKETPGLFSSNDPAAPMTRAFRAHTLMRKDGAAHMRERMAMAPAFAPKVIQGQWMPKYQEIATAYVDRLPRGEVVDLFTTLAAPYAARGLAVLLGTEAASDAEMIRWSQSLIDAAGNFTRSDALFAVSDRANDEMDALFDRLAVQHRVEQGPSAFAVMLNAEDPIELSQIHANIKIAIGGGINEPRDALCTILYGLLSNPEQLAEVRRNGDWQRAFEEGIRWVSPIQVSPRLVTEDTEIRGCLIPKGDTVVCVQASANRDEEIWPDGERFDVYRERHPHQSFGNGPHFCQGTHVARRAVADIMLPLLFDRFPNMELAGADDVVWNGFAFRGPINLPVRLI